MNDSPKGQDQAEQALDASLAQLPREALPRRDLWPEIESQLVERGHGEPASFDTNRETKPYNRRWMPFAVAASLLLSVIALGFSWNNLQSAKAFYSEGQRLADRQTSQSVNDQIKTMEHEYGLAKSVLLAQIAMNSASDETNLLMDINSNLLIIEQATDELKAAIIKQPENSGLLNLLNQTYQQELAVLSQLARLNQDS